MNTIERRLRRDMHLRIRQGGQLLLGQLGVVPAAAAWLLLAAVGVLSWLLGGIVLLIGLALTGTTIVVLARAGVPTHWPHLLLVASLILGTTPRAAERGVVDCQVRVVTPDPSSARVA